MVFLVYFDDDSCPFQILLYKQTYLGVLHK